MINIKVGELPEALSSIFNEISKKTLNLLEEASDKTADAVVSKLKATSPKKTGKFAKAWSKQKIKGLFSKGNIVYVKAPHYRLTHLLEWGHAKRNGGRVQGRKFVEPVEQEANRIFVEEVERNI